MKALFFVFSSLLAFQSPAIATEVWYTSNVGTHDLLDMFTVPHAWNQSRSKINVMKFYPYQLTSQTPAECPVCEYNIGYNFRARQAYQRLAEWNIELAVEHGAVKDWDCDGTKNYELSRQLFATMKSYGTRVAKIAMDEPFVSGIDYCKQSLEQTVIHTAEYMRRTRQAYKTYHPDQELSLGLIEAYPHFDVTSIIRMINLLHMRGQTPDFFHLDLDHWAVKSKKMSDSKVKQDLIVIKRNLARWGIPFGVIFWGHAKNNPSDYRKDVHELMFKVSRWNGGAPDHIIVQSWEETTLPNGQKVKRIPNNLPETDMNSGTGLLLYILKWFKI